MPIKLNTASGGGVILTGANTATDKTITVPAADGTMIYSDSSNNVTAPGNVLTTGSSSGVGYTTGAGGTVTQATNKSTAVTLNRPSGQIIMNNAALAAGTEVVFTFNNSVIASTDTLIANPVSFSNYRVRATIASAGVAEIGVTNVSGGSLSQAVPINFTVIKGATS